MSDFELDEGMLNHLLSTAERANQIDMTYWQQNYAAAIPMLVFEVRRLRATLPVPAASDARETPPGRDDALRQMRAALESARGFADMEGADDLVSEITAALALPVPPSDDTARRMADAEAGARAMRDACGALDDMGTLKDIWKIDPRGIAESVVRREGEAGGDAGERGGEG